MKSNQPELNDCVVQMLLKHGSPLTRRNYLGWRIGTTAPLKTWVQKNWRSSLKVSRNGLEPKERLTDGDVPYMLRECPSV